MTVFYTSDLHFFHRNIIRYCKRPFADLDDMHDQLIKRWNARVQPDDWVYCLGDFSFGSVTKSQPILDALRGHKVLIRGNHDFEHDCDRLHGWVEVRDLLEIKDGEQKLVLCHYPIQSWNKMHHGSLMLHGHCHGTLPTENNQKLDVGCDCWDYAPCTLNEIQARLKAYPDLKKIDHHGSH